MFSNKKENLFKTRGTSSTSNSFVSEGMKKSAETLSGNFALKYSSTGNDFLDQFGKMGTYKEPRSFSSISPDMDILWSQDPEKALKFTLFLRTITRRVQLMNGEKTKDVQKGSGLKHESIMRMLWIATNHPNTFWENITLFISVGSWKDIFTMLEYDITYNYPKYVLDHSMFYGLILAGLYNDNTCNLVKKYLPSLKVVSKAKTVRSQARLMIAKGLCNSLGINEKGYRALKSSGTAHDWQQKISQGKFNEIDFDTIHGRALSLLAGGKFIEKQGLEDRFEKWILSKPTAKYTGYVHELFQNVGTINKNYKKVLINKQFEQLVQVGKENINTQTGLIVVRDTSASMGSSAKGTNVSCYNIAKALALYFSEFLEGHFANSWIEFNHGAKMYKWKGSTPVDKWLNDKTSCIGNTNFQSVIKLFAQIKAKGVNESEFPTGILCISDGEFDSSELGKTNVENARTYLRDSGFSKEYVDNFKIILWNLQSRYYGEGTGEKFETHGDHTNVYYFSGYDGSIMSFLLGTKDNKSTPKNADELFEAAMDQEVLNMVTIV
jgi:hypothetical protein